MLCMCLSYCCCCYVSFLCFWSVLKALFHIYLLRIKCDACYVLYRITSIACVLRQSEQVWFDAPALTQQEIIKFLCEDVVCYFFFRRRFSSISVFHFGWWFWYWCVRLEHRHISHILSLSPSVFGSVVFFFFFILDRWSVGWCGTRSVHLAKVLHMAYAVAVATFHIDNGPKWNGSLFINYLLYGLWNRHQDKKDIRYRLKRSARVHPTRSSSIFGNCLCVYASCLCFSSNCICTVYTHAHAPLHHM